MNDNWPADSKQPLGLCKIGKLANPFGLRIFTLRQDIIFIANRSYCFQLTVVTKYNDQKLLKQNLSSEDYCKKRQ